MRKEIASHITRLVTKLITWPQADVASFEITMDRTDITVDSTAFTMDNHS